MGNELAEALSELRRALDSHKSDIHSTEMLVRDAGKIAERNGIEATGTILQEVDDLIYTVESLECEIDLIRRGAVNFLKRNGLFPTHDD